MFCSLQGFGRCVEGPKETGTERAVFWRDSSKEIVLLWDAVEKVELI
jgi:hypothetical protein